MNKSNNLEIFLSSLARFSQASFNLSQTHRITSYDFKSY